MPPRPAKENEPRHRAPNPAAHLNGLPGPPPEPGLGSTEDVGLVALGRLHKAMLIDEPWTERTARSFSWIGHRLRQYCTAGDLYQHGEVTLSRIACWVPVVDDVTHARSETEVILAKLNRFAIGSAYVFDEASRTIFGHLAGLVHGDTLEWRGRQLAAFAGCQLGQAESEAAYLARTTGGKIAERLHSTGGRRSNPDDVVDVIDSVIAIRGDESSKFLNAFEFQTIAEIAEKGNTATLGGSAKGICIEVPFSNRTSLLTLSADYLHPRIGSGLLVTVQTPMEVDETGLAALSGMLNRKEYAGEYGYQSLGAWGYTKVRQSPPVLGHTMFLPNITHTQGFTMDAFYGAVHRARWANQILNPGHEDVDAWELMLARCREVYPEMFGASEASES